jgi:hypothetical protein
MTNTPSRVRRERLTVAGFLVSRSGGAADTYVSAEPAAASRFHHLGITVPATGQTTLWLAAKAASESGSNAGYEFRAVAQVQPLVVDARELKALAMRYRLTQGQVRGLVAEHGLDRVALDRAAEKLRRH